MREVWRTDFNIVKKLVGDPRMTPRIVKTPDHPVALEQCGKCPVVSQCDAHVTGGPWKLSLADYEKICDELRSVLRVYHCGMCI